MSVYFIGTKVSKCFEEERKLYVTFQIIFAFVFCPLDLDVLK